MDITEAPLGGEANAIEADAREGLPAGPELPPSIQSIVFARDPVGVLLRCRARYGPVFTLRFVTVGPVVVVAEPNEALEIVHGDPESAHAGEARRAVLPQASPLSSFGADGGQHDAARGRIAPALSADRIELLEAEIASIVERHVEAWPRNAPIRVLSRMRSLTEEVFVRLVLGVDDEARGTAIVKALGRLLRTPGNPPMLPPDRDQGLPGRAVDRVFQRRLAPLAELLTEEVEAQRTRGGSGDGIIPHILSTNPSADAGRTIDELTVVLAAAQEPPSIALTWILERLSRDRELMARYLEADPGAPIRDAVVNETLRLRPPALAALRRLVSPKLVGANTLPSGTDVMVPTPLIHRDPRTFENPHTFRIARFLDSTLPATFIPFGGGVRSCPGEALARLEIRVVIPVILRRLALRFLGRPERPVQRATVLVPHRSGLAWISER